MYLFHCQLKYGSLEELSPKFSDLFSVCLCGLRRFPQGWLLTSFGVKQGLAELTVLAALARVLAELAEQRVIASALQQLRRTKSSVEWRGEETGKQAKR